MGSLAAEVNKLLSSSISENTKKSYNQGIASFDSFRLSHSLPITWPPQCTHIINYIAYLSKEGFTHSTVTAYIAGIAFKIKVMGHEDITRHFIIRKLLRGVSRKANSTDSRVPITLNILRKLPHALSHVCKSTYEAKLFSSAFTLAYSGFLRVGEMTLMSRNAHSTKVLQLSDVKIVNNSCHLCIRFSKTDQTGKTVTLVIPSAQDSTICPISNLQKYLAVRINTSSSVLFCHLDGSPLTRYQFSSVLKLALKFAGIKSTNFTSHSFRIGNATQCALQGIPSNKIQEMGRWNSPCFKRYIRMEKIIC